MFEKIPTKKLNYTCSYLDGKYDEIYNLPALTARTENQGFAYYVPREGATILQNVISITSNGNAGTIFYQPHEFTILQDSYALKFKSKELSERHQLFFVTCLQKATSHFDWTNKAVWEKVRNLLITLPTINNQIAFDFMQDLMTALSKQVVHALNAYTSLKIQTAKEVINK